ncbi:MAG: hypothetical protein LBP40_00375 [Campylobacteraceae bacterium]|jgi:hypothetical protein|nr:hypothetical protein [Campylobacteraceae bacterium]
MATWTDLPQANIEPEKPIRASDIWAIYQNIKALAEGAEGAPKIMPAAFSNVSAGTNVLGKISFSVQSTGDKGQVSIFCSGTLTFITTTVNGATLRWYRNNTAVGVNISAGTISQNFEVANGDTFTIRVTDHESTTAQASASISCSIIGLPMSPATISLM